MILYSNIVKNIESVGLRFATVMPEWSTFRAK